MMRDIFRIVGIGCLLAGGILYFTTDSRMPSNKDAQQLQIDVEKLQSELAKTKELLAIAQTTSTVQNNGTKENDDTQNTIFTIESGSNSTVVSAGLERLGIIEDAALFNSYLEDNNLTAKIQVGDHSVNSSMDFETISKEITTGKK